MDVSSIGSLSSTLVLRKAMDIQAQSATQLLEALPPVTNNPPNLGNSVDIKA